MAEQTVQEPEVQTQEKSQEPEGQIQEPKQDDSQPKEPEKTESLGWRAALEKDLQDHPLVKDYTKPSDFVRKAVEWYSKLEQIEQDSSNRVKIPASDAPKEEWEAFFKQIGRPEKPEEYEVTDSEYLPEEFVSQFKKIAFDAGLTKTQAKDVVGLVNRFLTQMAEQAALNEDRQKAQQIEALKEEWGDQYEERKRQMERLAFKLFGDMPDFIKWAKNSGFYDSVAFNRMLFSISEKVGQDTLLEGALNNSYKEDDVGYSFPNTPGMQ